MDLKESMFIFILVFEKRVWLEKDWKIKDGRGWYGGCLGFEVRYRGGGICIGNEGFSIVCWGICIYFLIREFWNNIK